MIPLRKRIPQGDPGSRLRAERPGGAADLHRRPFQLRRPHRRGVLFPAPSIKEARAGQIKNDGTRYNTNIKQVFTFQALGKKEQQEVHAGDIWPWWAWKTLHRPRRPVARTPCASIPSKWKSPRWPSCSRHRPARSSAARATSWERAAQGAPDAREGEQHLHAHRGA